ncbi:transcription factor IIIC subunit delta N-term-domain-containing protein [Entophlyctis helioformis]|nr:transcription factor IIIC subunit delta N-term-domain-containing protein [Entophlyctis helioformis]
MHRHFHDNRTKTDMQSSGLVLVKAPNAPDCVSWSPHGQIAVLMPSHVHILTPTLSGTATSASLAATSDVTTASLVPDEVVQRSVVLIETAAADAPKPAAMAASLASIKTPEPGENMELTARFAASELFRRCAWSPVCASKTFGCLLLTLTTAFRVLLWEPIGDPASGSWRPILDLADTLQRHADRHAEFKKQAMLVVSIAWSESLHGSTASLVACGTKTGHVFLIRFDNESVSVVASFKAHESRVSLIEFTRVQTQTDQGTSLSIVTGGIDGSISARIITASDNGNAIDIGPVRRILEADHRLVTVVKCAPTANLVAIGRSNHLVLCSLDGHLASARISQHMAVSSITWSRDSSEMRVYSTDGRFLVVGMTVTGRQGNTDVKAAQVDVRQDLSKALLAQVLRHAKLNDGEDESDEEDGDEGEGGAAGHGADAANAGDEAGQAVAAGTAGEALRLRVFGSAQSANGIYDYVVHMIEHNNRQLYKTDGTLTCPSIIWTPVPLPPSESDGDALTDEQLVGLIAKLSASDTFTTTTPFHTLWDVVQHMVGLDMAPSLPSLERVQHLGRLLETAPDMVDANVVMTGIETLFCDPVVNRLRLQISLYSASMSLWRHAPWSAPSDAAEAMLGIRDAVGAAARVVQRQYLECMFKSLAAMAVSADTELLLPEPDALVVSLLAKQYRALVARSTDDTDPLTLAFKHLGSVCPVSWNRLLGIVSTDPNGMDVDDAEDARGTEPCPACDASVPFHHPAFGVCPQGHKWERCQLSMRLVSTPLALTCLGCKRRRLPRPSLGTDSSPVDRLMDTVRQCLLCGNGFRGAIIPYAS